MNAKLPVIDLLIDTLMGSLDEDLDWSDKKEHLRSLISRGAPCYREWPLKLIDDYCESNTDVRILDYGCGTGILNVLLLLKGYGQVDGVDVVKKFDRRILSGLGFNNGTFELVKEGVPLPFENDTFDIINSSLVLEHVRDIDFYYSEAARVLKPGGVCFFNFPHRLKPYDSHSRCWFIHYFPTYIRRILWNLFARQGGVYMNDYLFLRTMGTHKRVASRYFGVVEDRSYARLQKNLKGSSGLRGLIYWICNLKWGGRAISRLLANGASADLFLRK